MTERFSPADLECLCRRAYLNAVVRNEVERMAADAAVVVTATDLQQALREVSPTVTEADLEAIDRWTPR